MRVRLGGMREGIRPRFSDGQSYSRVSSSCTTIGGGGGGGGSNAFAGWTHSECGGRKLHVEGLRSLQSSQLLQLLLQSPVLFCQRLATSLQILAIYLCLLQLGSAYNITRKNF